MKEAEPGYSASSWAPPCLRDASCIPQDERSVSPHLFESSVGEQKRLRKRQPTNRRINTQWRLVPRARRRRASRRIVDEGLRRLFFIPVLYVLHAAAAATAVRAAAPAAAVRANRGGNKGGTANASGGVDCNNYWRPRRHCCRCSVSTLIRTTAPPFIPWLTRIYCFCARSL